MIIKNLISGKPNPQEFQEQSKYEYALPLT